MNPTLSAGNSQGNFETIRKLIREGGVPAGAIVVLPEHYTREREQDHYESQIRELAVSARSWIVGGSHHGLTGGHKLNSGVVYSPEGVKTGSYAKLRPYAAERAVVEPGDTPGELEIAGLRVLVMVCADFWYSDLIHRADNQPDIIIVPALSVSRKPRPEYSRTLWHHLAISRAYEFGALAAISDWGEDSTLPNYRTCGVGGIADPSELEPERFFRPATSGGISVFEFDADRLNAFREDRRQRGFFWRP